MLKYLGLIMLALFSSRLLADKWRFEKEIKEDSFRFGETEIIRIQDTTKNQYYPTFSTKVIVSGKIEAIFKNLTFDKIAPVGKSEFLVGISNSGLSQFAYFVMTTDGKLIKTVNHSRKIPYCQQSVTLKRLWVELDNLEFDIGVDKKRSTIESVTVQGCKGKK